MCLVIFWQCYATITNLIREFKRGREDIKDAPCPGRLMTEVTEEIDENIHQMVLKIENLAFRIFRRKFFIHMKT